MLIFSKHLSNKDYDSTSINVYKRIIIFSIIVLSSVLAGMLPPKQWIHKWLHLSGYYFIFSAFFLWIFLLLKQYAIKIKPALTSHWIGLLLSILCTLLIFTISPPKFKILSDETNLIGVSMSMYQEKTASIPLQGYHLDYDYPKYEYKIDKRPLFFPFLTSLVHTVSGYNARNGFVVNFISGILIFFIIYIFVNWYFPRIYAFLSIIILASLPNYIFWITSSGFEAVNLLFILLSFLMLHQFLIKRSAERAEMLFLTLILLAQCRYESIIFTIVAIFLFIFLINKSLISRFSPITYLTPIFFILVLWQRRLFADLPHIVRYDSNLFQITNIFETFNLYNFFSNSSKNIFVFLGMDPNYGFTPIIAILSIIGSYLLIRKFILQFNTIQSQFRYIFLYSITTLLLLSVIIYSHYWGNFTIALQNRIALVFLPYLLFPAIYGLYKISGPIKFSKEIFLSVFFIFHLLFFLPYGTHQRLINSLSLPFEYKKNLTYLEKNFHGNKNILIISDRPNLYLVHEYGSVSFDFLKRHKEEISFQSQKEFDHVLTFQRYHYKNTLPDPKNRLDNSVILTELENIKITPLMYIKISEIKKM